MSLDDCFFLSLSLPRERGDRPCHNPERRICQYSQALKHIFMLTLTSGREGEEGAAVHGTEQSKRPRVLKVFQTFKLWFLHLSVLNLK